LVDDVSRTIEVRYRGQEKFEVIGIFKAGDQVISPVLPGLNLAVTMIFEP
jgi:hypothetical protein